MRNTKIKQTFAVKAFGQVYIILRSQIFFMILARLCRLKQVIMVKYAYISAHNKKNMLLSFDCIEGQLNLAILKCF